MAKQKTHEKYEEELLDVEAKLYPVESYSGSVTKIKHKCIEGHIIEIRPRDVLKGIGCSICNGNHTKTHQEYLEELSAKNILYIPIEQYINARTSIEHFCTNCGNVWKVRPRAVVYDNSGCPSCAKTGFDLNKPAILYYVKIQYLNEIYYKIGVTNRTVRKRLNRDGDKLITILLEEKFELGKDAKAKEKEILEKYKDKKLNKVLLNSKGNTEIFICDILELDNTN
jgi:predicted  nucleic acid-binding Zn-ribbon protein